MNSVATTKIEWKDYGVRVEMSDENLVRVSNTDDGERYIECAPFVLIELVRVVAKADAEMVRVSDAIDQGRDTIGGEPWS